MSTPFDTSGAVCIETARDHASVATQLVRWSDLTPFTQGYIEAVFASIERTTKNLVWDRNDNARFPVFSDLAPETLAAIMEDCRRYVARGPDAMSPKQGAEFWGNRNANHLANWFAAQFPRLTPTLGDDGRVYLRSAA